MGDSELLLGGDFFSFSRIRIDFWCKNLEIHWNKAIVRFSSTFDMGQTCPSFRILQYIHVLTVDFQAICKQF